MTYKEAYKDIFDWLVREAERLQNEIEDIEADIKDEGVPSRGSATNLMKVGARASQVAEIISEMQYQMDEEIEDNEQNAAIKFCHEHKLLMIPVDLYHTLNVAYKAYMLGISYEDAEKMLLDEVNA